MPHRKLASRELAELFGALAHPERLRIIEELRSRECDVTTLATLLEVSPARASRHLALLRTHRQLGCRSRSANRLVRSSGAATVPSITHVIFVVGPARWSRSRSTFRSRSAV